FPLHLHRRGTAAGNHRDSGKEDRRARWACRPARFARHRRLEDMARLLEEGKERGLGIAATDNSTARTAQAAGRFWEVFSSVNPIRMAFTDALFDCHEIVCRLGP